MPTNKEINVPYKTNTVEKYPYIVYAEIENKLKFLEGSIDELESSLPSTAFTDTNTVKKYVDDSIETVNAPDIIIIGDSWSDTRPEATTYIKWPVIFEQYVKCSLHNYARNGSSINGADNFAENGTFGGQVAAAIADTNYNHDNVKLIIIMGGLNDYRGNTSYSTVGTAFDNIVSRLKTEFENARIIFFVNYQTLISAQQFSFIYRLTGHAQSIGIPAYNMINWFLVSDFISDYCHPNNNGYKAIASNVIACCFGGSPNTFNTHATLDIYLDGDTNKVKKGTLDIREVYTQDYALIDYAITVTDQLSTDQKYRADVSNANFNCLCAQLNNALLHRFITSSNTANIEQGLAIGANSVVTGSQNVTSGCNISMVIPGIGGGGQNLYYGTSNLLTRY